MIVQQTLASGLTLVTDAMPEVRSVAIGVWLRRGSRHERPEASGVSHFIEHMVFKGTTHRSAERIAAEVDSIGGYMDAFTAKEYASFHLKVLDQTCRWPSRSSGTSSRTRSSTRRRWPARRRSSSRR